MTKKKINLVRIQTEYRIELKQTIWCELGNERGTKQPYLAVLSVNHMHTKERTSRQTQIQRWIG